jgi:glucose-6-phosphate dehydrogenase assembly protein OpcA
MSTAVVRPESLLKELSGLWTQLGKQESEGSDRSAGVLRAVTMTFLLGVDESDDGAAAGEALAQLMHEHPSRAIVLKLKRDAEAGLEGRAFAQCWMPFGRRQQICCEQIEVSAGELRFHDIYSLMPGLLAPDLPTVFWCRGAEVFHHPSFHALAGLADKVIVDSRTHKDPMESLKFIDGQLRAGRVYGDLTWTRLTRWRETVAGMFERLDCQDFLPSLQRVEIHHTQAPEPMAAIYLRAWFRMILGPNIPVVLVHDPVAVSWQIREIRFVNGKSDIAIVRGEKGIVESQVREFRARSVFEVLDEARLVREEITILGRDRIFADVVSLVSQS